MALNPKDKNHLLQIQAGILGRNVGHNFEATLTKQINNLALKLLDYGKVKDHLYVGEPALQLVKYIISRKGLVGITKVEAFWLGGLATAGAGSILKDTHGNPIKKCKSDILIRFEMGKKITEVGVSVKSCNRKNPTNAQLFCSTAKAFCNLLRVNGIKVSVDIENGLKMFCGEKGFRPDDLINVKNRKSSTERFFYEELPEKVKKGISSLIKNNQNLVTRLLLQKAYLDDPYSPEFILHKIRKETSAKKIPVAIFSLDELIILSEKYKSFKLNGYKIKKGRFKNDPNEHFAPRFGCIQFQRLGNVQNATQLQFNLEAGYFFKITGQLV